MELFVGKLVIRPQNTLQPCFALSVNVWGLLPLSCLQPHKISWVCPNMWETEGWGGQHSPSTDCSAVALRFHDADFGVTPRSKTGVTKLKCYVKLSHLYGGSDVGGTLWLNQWKDLLFNFTFPLTKITFLWKTFYFVQDCLDADWISTISL